ncbi:hypothetical protein [Chondrinema litorale]|uniref:hypothetical protein n=1 Tax=Chondrinema litorale TaxID=2994555 RepID=UPI002543C94F|nr:hypothetical protein [Chondrinema litorale]UZR94641.1 hypothetical protein OQ292_02260 [Chondrinema litorale]
MSSKFKSIAIKVGLVVAGLLLFYFLFLYFGNYSTGTRGGIVMKISKKGYLFKTYEGQLDVGAINEPWSFSVDGGKEEVIQALDEAQQSGERVQLHYAEKYRTFFWRGDTKYFITKVTRQPPK